MKNSLQAEPKPKVNLKDIIEGKEMREQATFEVGGVRYWADRISKNQIATHVDCEDCGIEFEKDYTIQRFCFVCNSKRNSEKYSQLELVEWDGKSMLCVWDDDTFFSDPDEALEYCEENEINPAELRLVICKETSFGNINIAECLQDDLHEDWEPDAELTRIQKELDTYLKTASTNTWTASNKRISLV